MSHDTNSPDSIPEEIWLASQIEANETPYAHALENFNRAITAQYASLREVIAGEGGSVQEDIVLTETLLVNVAQSFARLSMLLLDDDSLNPEDTVEQIAWIFYSSRQERLEFFQTLAPGAEFMENDSDEALEAITFVLTTDDESDEDDIEKALECAFGNVCKEDIMAILPFASPNKQEIRKQQKEARKAFILRSLGDIAKIGTGAALAIAAHQYLKRK